MATSWPAITADDVSSGRGAKTTGLTMFQRDRCVEQSGVTVKVSGNTASATYAVVDTFTIQMPTFAVAGRTFRLFVNLTDTGGSSNFKIEDNATSTSGTESAAVAATTDAVESVLTIGSSWTGERLINVYAKTSGSDATVDTLSLAINARWGD